MSGWNILACGDQAMPMKNVFEDVSNNGIYQN